MVFLNVLECHYFITISASLHFDFASERADLTQILALSCNFQLFISYRVCPLGSPLFAADSVITCNFSKSEANYTKIARLTKGNVFQLLPFSCCLMWLSVLSWGVLNLCPLGFLFCSWIKQEAWGEIRCRSTWCLFTNIRIKSTRAAKVGNWCVVAFLSFLLALTHLPVFYRLPPNQPLRPTNVRVNQK